MKKMVAGLLFLAIFLAASVGGIIASILHAPSVTENKAVRGIMPSGDEGGSQKPFARLCGDEGGPSKPFSDQPSS